jgi:hypothetical protein
VSPNGFSGTMRPLASKRILSATVQALPAITKSKREQGQMEYNFIDFGRSSGQTCASAAILVFLLQFMVWIMEIFEVLQSKSI